MGHGFKSTIMFFILFSTLLKEAKLQRSELVILISSIRYNWPTWHVPWTAQRRSHYPSCHNGWHSYSHWCPTLLQPRWSPREGSFLLFWIAWWLLPALSESSRLKSKWYLNRISASPWCFLRALSWRRLVRNALRITEQWTINQNHWHRK